MVLDSYPTGNKVRSTFHALQRSSFNMIKDVIGNNIKILEENVEYFYPFEFRKALVSRTQSPEAMKRDRVIGPCKKFKIFHGIRHCIQS